MQQAPIKVDKKPLDGVFTAIAVFLFLGGFYLIGSMYFAASPWYIRLAIVLVSLVGAVLSLAATSHRQRFLSLVRGAQIELRKVHWPGKNEWLVTTGKVIVCVMVFALFLSLVDWILASIIRWIL